jgi:septum formation protein
MLISDLSLVRAAHIVLASASPRRSSILNEQFGLNVRTVPSTFDESLDKSMFAPVEYAKETARQKALEVFSRSKSPFEARHGLPPSLVVGADTIVVLDGQILEKPTSRENARQMLRDLSSAGTHTVCTAVSLVYGGSDEDVHEHCFAEETKVIFRELSEDEIEEYVASGEPMDKAGSYGIQALGGAFVTKIEGDYQVRRARPTLVIRARRSTTDWYTNPCIGRRSSASPQLAFWRSSIGSGLRNGSSARSRRRWWQSLRIRLTRFG